MSDWNPEPPSPLESVGEMAERLGVRTSTANNWVRRDDFPKPVEGGWVLPAKVIAKQKYTGRLIIDPATGRPKMVQPDPRWMTQYWRKVDVDLWVERHRASLSSLKPKQPVERGGIHPDDWPVGVEMSMVDIQKAFNLPTLQAAQKIVTGRWFPEPTVDIPRKRRWDSDAVYRWAMHEKTTKSKGLRYWIGSTYTEHTPKLKPRSRYGEIDAHGIAELFGVSVEVIYGAIFRDPFFPQPCVEDRPGIWALSDVLWWLKVDSSDHMCKLLGGDVNDPERVRIRGASGKNRPK